MIALAWTFVVGASLAWNLTELRTFAENAVAQEARGAYERDVVFRRWVAQMGGVYVPADKVEPNPYLDVPHRDLTTTGGLHLTLVNPAYMTRMVYDMHSTGAVMRGHITSLKPLRPQNGPDPWERRALERFEAGVREVTEVTEVEGRPHLRLMRPFRTEADCLKCHEDQGYEVGDVRGGVSVSIPMAPYFDQAKDESFSLVALHLTMWLLGLGGLVWAARRLSAEGRNVLAAREEALAASQVKSQFLANMSHELRTPINGILGLASALEQDDLAPEQRSALRTIRTSGDTLLSVVNDILDLTKVEAGRIDLEALPFRPAEALEDVARLVRPRAEARGLALVVEVGDAVPERVVGDPNRVRQVLLNLATNAAKFTERGSIRIGAAHLGGHRIRFEVEDSGPGIPAAELPRLFEPFTQGDASTARLHGGSGLGLSIARRLVERMGGDLTVDTEVGRGSCFAFTLPLSAAPAEAPTPSAAEPTPARSVLLVEDNAVNQLVATRLLERLGHRVAAVGSGVEALDRLAAEAVDLVLMDLQMPEMDGLETTRRLRAAGFASPIVALTANAHPEARQACLDAGMDDHLAKPITLESLRAAIDRWADRT